MMRNNSTGRRVSLDSEATQFLEEEIKRLKANKKYVKINENKLVSQIVSLFFQKFYKKCEDEVLSPFIDRKAYLMEIIKNADSDEDILASMKKHLKKSKRKKTTD